MNLSFIGDGVVIGCSEERFSEYVAEMKPITDKVISSLEPAPEAWTVVVISSWFLCGQLSIVVLLTF